MYVCVQSFEFVFIGATFKPFFQNFVHFRTGTCNLRWVSQGGGKHQNPADSAYSLGTLEGFKNFPLFSLP